MSTAEEGLKTDCASWEFGSKVADNFDLHARKSTLHNSKDHVLITNPSGFFVTSSSVFYALSCSTGTLACKLASQNPDKNSLSIHWHCC